MEQADASEAAAPPASLDPIGIVEYGPMPAALHPDALRVLGAVRAAEQLAAATRAFGVIAQEAARAMESLPAISARPHIDYARFLRERPYTWSWPIHGESTISISIRRPRPRQRRVNREYERKRAEPERRANALLKSFLTPFQRREYKRHGWFHVKAPSGRRYRIERRPIANVLGMERRGGRRTRYCIVARQRSMPLPDVMLAVKIMIETDEDRFLKTALYAGGFRRNARSSAAPFGYMIG